MDTDKHMWMDVHNQTVSLQPATKTQGEVQAANNNQGEVQAATNKQGEYYTSSFHNYLKELPECLNENTK
jgi:hypothetical protein